MHTCISYTIQALFLSRVGYIWDDWEIILLDIAGSNASVLFVSGQNIFSVRSSDIPENIDCPSRRLNWAHYYEILQSDEYVILIYSITQPRHSEVQISASKS